MKEAQFAAIEPTVSIAEEKFEAFLESDDLQALKHALRKASTSLPENMGLLLNCSIEGWQRLQERGHFQQPASSNATVRKFDDLGDPLGAFIRGWCIVGPAHSIRASELYASYTMYCDDNDHVPLKNVQAFGTALADSNAGAEIELKQRRVNGGRERYYAGIKVR